MAPRCPGPASRGEPLGRGPFPGDRGILCSFPSSTGGSPGTGLGALPWPAPGPSHGSFLCGHLYAGQIPVPHLRNHRLLVLSLSRSPRVTSRHSRVGMLSASSFPVPDVWLMPLLKHRYLRFRGLGCPRPRVSDGPRKPTDQKMVPHFTERQDSVLLCSEQKLRVTPAHGF